MRKKKNKTIKVNYECVGTEAENQERLDKVFDLIFDKVLEKLKTKK